jgi:methyltransferase (TIGR00027 family)
MSELLKSVADTSRIMAAIRAVENERVDRLFRDPFAAKLAGEDTIIKVLPKIQENENKGIPYVAVRTKYFDDWLMSLTDQIKQIVLLGAGLDTRAFRLNLPPDIHFYELDQENVIEYKNSVLQCFSPNCHRHTIVTDLRESWSKKLISSGFQIEQPTAWLIEGVFYYLTEEEVKNLLEKINQLSSKKSYLAADFISEATLKTDDDLAQYWQFGCNNPQSFLSNYGWQSLVVQPCDSSVNCGRFTFQFPSLDVEDAVRTFFATASQTFMSC